MSGNNGDDVFFMGVAIGVMICSGIATMISMYDDSNVFKHNNVVEVSGRHYKIVEVVVNTEYTEVVK